MFRSLNIKFFSFLESRVEYNIFNIRLILKLTFNFVIFANRSTSCIVVISIVEKKNRIDDICNLYIYIISLILLISIRKN